ncbi:DUF3575 domain-containing protein [Flavobacteriaceae bacterium]|nr:DUF3575 domain-containing protein [Flavobacteriaceae bacterium]
MFKKKCSQYYYGKNVSFLIKGFINTSLFLYVLFYTSHLSAQVEVKFNVASAFFLVPNVGLEFQVGEKTSIQLDVLAIFKDEFNGNPLLATQSFGEFRYYQKQNNLGWFVGGHVGFGMFMLQKPSFSIIYDKYGDTSRYNNDENSFRTGRIWYYGLTVGYKKSLSKRWSLEAFVGGGLTQSWYKMYVDGVQVGDLDRPFNGSSEVLGYRGGVMVVYKVFPYKKK